MPATKNKINRKLSFTSASDSARLVFQVARQNQR